MVLELISNHILEFVLAHRWNSFSTKCAFKWIIFSMEWRGFSLYVYLWRGETTCRVLIRRWIKLFPPPLEDVTQSFGREIEFWCLWPYQTNCIQYELFDNIKKKRHILQVRLKGHRTMPGLILDMPDLFLVGTCRDLSRKIRTSGILILKVLNFPWKWYVA